MTEQMYEDEVVDWENMMDKYVDGLLVDPEYIKWGYDSLKLPRDTWKNNGFESLVDRVRVIEQERVEFYFDRAMALEKKLAKKEQKLESAYMALGGVLVVVVGAFVLKR